MSLLKCEALGLIETWGLVGALEAADAAAKAAAINIRGYRVCGGGLVTIALTGPVAAVGLAVSTGVIRAAMVGKVYSSHVIARPVESVVGSWLGPEHHLPGTPDPGGENQEEPLLEPFDEQDAVQPVGLRPSEEEQEAPVLPVVPESGCLEEDDLPALPDSLLPEITCNLCGDPTCPRRKGEPRSTCLHHTEP